MNRDLALYSASEDENEWDPTSKSIEEIRAFLKKWERECRKSNYARIAKENAAYKKQRREKLTVRLAKKGRVYHSDEDDGAFCYDTDFQEDIWEDEGHEEETREFYARACVPGDINFIYLGWCPVVHSIDKIFVMHSELVEKLLDSEQSHDCQQTVFSV